MRKKRNIETCLSDSPSQKKSENNEETKVNLEIEKLLSECRAPEHLPKSILSAKNASNTGTIAVVSKIKGMTQKKTKQDTSELQKSKYDKKNDPRIDSTLFIGNISLHVSEKELLNKLELKKSDIISVRFRSLPIHPKFASNKKVGAALECFSGNSGTKNAYLILKDKSIMKGLIDKYSGALLSGNHLRLTPASKGNQFSTFDRKRTVFIGGLPKFCTEDELRRFVTFSINEDCINSVRIIKSSTTGKPKGFGFVLFNDRKYVVLAIKTLNGSIFRGSAITVTKALSEEDAKKKLDSIDLKVNKGMNKKTKNKMAKKTQVKKTIKKTKMHVKKKKKSK